MLSRSNFSIRRLMPQRRQNSDDDLFWDNDEKASLKVTDGRGSPSPSLKVEPRKRRNSRSWISKGSTKKIPQPIIVVRSTEDLHRITHLPPLPDTPHSSKSSLCSCEQHAAGYASPRRLPRGASPGPSPGHGSIRSKTCSERRISPPPGSPLENPRPSPRLPTETRQNKSVKSLPSPTKLTFDLLEALEIQPDNEEMATPVPIMPSTPPRRKSTPTLDQGSGQHSENIQQLIQEADEAFGTVGVDMRTVGKSDLDSRVPDQETAIAPPPTRPAPTPPVRRRPPPLRHPLIKKRLSQPVLPPLKSPARSASVSKAKRQKSQKLRNGRPPRPVVKKQRSKWSVNAKDLLTVRLFSRLEVDEVLSPTRLQEIRMSGASLMRSRRSSETLRTIQSDGSDTPVDPFNLQDLPTRIGAAGVRLSIPSPIVEVPTPRTFDFNLTAERRRSSLREEKSIIDETSFLASPSSDETTPTQTLPEDEEMAFDDLAFPVPPAKNPVRFTSISSRKDPPQLPSIPELMVTTPENFILTSSEAPQPQPHTPRPSPDEPFLYLPSNPYTLTMPGFRHGPIRIAKADVALAYSSSKLATAVLDDSLDWTAFHMAILGGAGDLYGEATDYSRRDGIEEDELDDLCEWYAEFGFAGWGGLDRGTAPASPVTVVEGSCSPVSSRSSKSGRHLPIPVEQEFPNGFWNGRLGDEMGRDASSRFDRARSVGLRRWTVEGHPKRYHGGTMSIDSSRRPSVDSMASPPQSPMLDLVVSQDAGGNEYIVPMGYNLSHDLGDFLSWEAENVYAAAFLGGEEEGDAELEA
jgi:hypothetical protein